MSVIHGYDAANATAPRVIGADGDALKISATANDGGGFPRNIDAVTFQTTFGQPVEGALKVSGAQQWSLVFPAAGGARANAALAAPGAGRRHILQAVHASLSGAGSSFQDLFFEVSDGLELVAVFSAYLWKPLNAATANISISGLNVPLSEDAALQAGFNAAPGDPNVFQSFSVYGITVI